MTDPAPQHTHPIASTTTPAPTVIATTDTPPGTDPPSRYEPPHLTDLGTLAQLTHGGTVGLSDGVGFAGAAGSV
jgi:hypothetical protein